MEIGHLAEEVLFVFSGFDVFLVVFRDNGGDRGRGFVPDIGFGRFYGTGTVRGGKVPRVLPMGYSRLPSTGELRAK